MYLISATEKLKAMICVLNCDKSNDSPNNCCLNKETSVLDIRYISHELKWENFLRKTKRGKFYDFSTDSGWDNPFRPDGDLSREADEIVELIKGGKPITPTPGQNAPPLPGCDGKSGDSSTSPLLKSANCHANSSPRPGQENGSAHGGTPSKAGNQPVNEKVWWRGYIIVSDEEDTSLCITFSQFLLLIR